MHLVNTSVVSSSRTLLPWTIIQIKEEEHSVSDFFLMNLKPKISDYNCELMSAFIGQDKNSLDEVDISLPIVPVISSFGRFLRYSVEIESHDNSAQTVSELPSNMSLIVNTVHPMNQRNNKDKLYNDVLSFLVSAQLMVQHSEVLSIKKFISLLRDIFWHIDGHHHVFNERSQPIPSVFNAFVGYNCPEKSKHRRRRTQNLSSDCLQNFSLELDSFLHLPVWDRAGWINLKPPFTELLSSLSVYTDYLAQKNKRMKKDHRSPTPVREISEHIHLKFIPANNQPSTDSSCSSIELALSNLQPYEASSISHLLPSNSVQKHRAVNAITSTGFNFPCIFASLCTRRQHWQLPFSVES